MARNILMYLAAHPNSQTTLEGVVQWWLLEQEIRQQTALVQSALAQLVSLGLVIERRGADGHVRYQVNRRKAREISAMLEESGIDEQPQP